MITKQQTLRKISSQMDEVKKWAMERAKYLLNSSGVIDFSDYDNDYELPKIILASLLSEAEFQFGPITTENRRVVESLKRFR